MKIRIKALSIDSRRNIFWILASVVALSVGVYIFGVLATVNHTIAKKNLMAENGRLASKVSELEFKDISLKNKINIEVALASGYNEVKSPFYVSRSRESLTLNTVSR